MGYLFAFLSAISWAFGTISLVLSKHQLNPNVFNLYKQIGTKKESLVSNSLIRWGDFLASKIAPQHRNKTALLPRWY